jgi:uncharacterized cofD-like protein
METGDTVAEGNGKKSVVVIGGGTGTHTLLRGLKRYADLIDIKVIVTMADSGGSTGRLRDEFGYLPVGDARMALTALARDIDEENEILRQLFLYRFDRGEGLAGHTLGNLFLVALTDILGSEAAAIRAAGKVLATCGEVIPVTTDNVHLEAEYDNGEIARTEHEIDTSAHADQATLVKRLSLSTHARVSERAAEAIQTADLIVLGPGDFYTSILANCVVEGVPKLLKGTRAQLVYISNLMSRNGQTNGMGTDGYLREIETYIGRVPEYMIVNTTPLRADLVTHYETDGERPVEHTYTGGETKVIVGDFVAQNDVKKVKGDALKRSLIRHDPEKLARAIMQLV